MNKLFFLPIALLTIISCSESIPNQDNVVEHLRRQMKNPDSFRMDSIKYKPFLLSDQLKSEMTFDTIMVSHYIEMKDHYSQSIDRLKGLSYMSDFVEGYRKDYKSYQNKIDSANTHLSMCSEKFNSVIGTDADTLVSHTYTVFYMAQNSFGAYLKGSAHITCKPNFTPFPDGEVYKVHTEKD